MKKLFKKSIFVLLALAILGMIVFSGKNAYAQTTSSFRTGDVVTAFNNTKGGSETDTITADPGNVIEYRMVIQNMTPNTVAKDVQVGILWPQTPSKHLVLTMEASANGFNKVSDTATLDVTNTNTTHLLDYYGTGHARVASPFCPNVCTLDDRAFLAGEPINIGDLAFGESAQVLFKASVNRPTEPTVTPTPNPTATPRPTATPTARPSATPTVAPTATPQPTVAPTVNPSATPGTVNCNGSIIQVGAGQSANCNNNNNVNNNTQNQTVNVTNTATNPSSSPVVQVLAASTSNVKELPNTGLPLAGLALAGLTPIGLKLKKFGKGIEALSPSHIWEMREFNKES